MYDIEIHCVCVCVFLRINETICVFFYLFTPHEHTLKAVNTSDDMMIQEAEK
jgi:hypothetical protein